MCEHKGSVGIFLGCERKVDFGAPSSPDSRIYPGILLRKRSCKTCCRQILSLHKRPHSWEELAQCISQILNRRVEGSYTWAATWKKIVQNFLISFCGKGMLDKIPVSRANKTRKQCNLTQWMMYKPKACNTTGMKPLGLVWLNRQPTQHSWIDKAIFAVNCMFRGQFTNCAHKGSHDCAVWLRNDSKSWIPPQQVHTPQLFFTTMMLHFSFQKKSKGDKFYFLFIPASHSRRSL